MQIDVEQIITRDLRANPQLHSTGVLHLILEEYKKAINSHHARMGALEAAQAQAAAAEHKDGAVVRQAKLITSIKAAIQGLAPVIKETIDAVDKRVAALESQTAKTDEQRSLDVAVICAEIRRIWER